MDEPNATGPLISSGDVCAAPAVSMEKMPALPGTEVVDAVRRHGLFSPFATTVNSVREGSKRTIYTRMGRKKKGIKRMRLTRGAA